MNGEPVNSYHGAFRPFNGFVLSYTGSLVGAIEIDGIDPDGMSQKDMEAFSIVIRNLLNILPQSIVLQQYYIHYRDLRIAFLQRKNPVCNALNQYRASHLNKMHLSGAKCILFVEVYPEHQGQSSLSLFIRHLLKCLQSAASREHVRRFYHVWAGPGLLSKSALEKTGARPGKP